MIITGTSTGVGKTIATASLAWAWQMPVLKPLQTGDDSDTGTIEKLTGIKGKVFQSYPDPLAPNLAARRAGMPQADRAELAEWISSQIASDGEALIEGAGGLLVRLGQDRHGEDFTLLDIARDLGQQLVVVTSTGLGSLNAAELTVRYARQAGVEVVGIIGGSLPRQPDLATAANIDELPRVTETDLWYCLPEGAGQLDREQFCALVDSLPVPPLPDVSGGESKA